MWCSHEWGPGTAVRQRLAVKVFRGLRFLKTPSPPPPHPNKKKRCVWDRALPSRPLGQSRPCRSKALRVKASQPPGRRTQNSANPGLFQPGPFLRSLKLNLTCQNYHTNNSNLKIAMTSIVTITNSCNTATNNLSLKKNSILYDLPEQENTPGAVP